VDGLGLAAVTGWMDERDLNTFVRPVIERALLSGELVLVERTPISGWTPAIANMPREEATVGAVPEAMAPASR